MLPEVEAEARAALALGDHAAAATALVKGYGPQILGYLRAVLRDDDAATEVFAQLGADLWQGLAGFRGDSSLKTWAYKIAWHAALAFLNEPYRRRREGLDSGLAAELVAAVRTTTALHLKTESKDQLAELRAALKPDEQTLLILRIDRQLAWSEVAEVMAQDERALRKRFERLKERLRKLAEERGLLGQRRDSF